MKMNKWKPKVGETYYVPWLIDYEVDYIDIVWNDFPWDEQRYNAGVVCHTKEEALELARKMLLVAKNDANEALKEHIKAISRYCRSRADCDECCLTTLNGYYCFPNWKSPDHWEKDIDSVLKEHEQ